MSNINSIAVTINDALVKAGVEESDLNRRFGHLIEPVAEALIERDYVITETVIEAVVNHLNVSEDDAVKYAEQFGLSVRPQPEPEPEVEVEVEVDAEVEGNGDKLDAILLGLKTIGERIDKIESAAARNGISL